VEGDIRVSGRYEHSVLLVATGNIYITGDVRAKEGDVTQTPVQLGLFAKRDVIIPENVETQQGNLTVEAFIMADGEGQSTGILKAEGTPFSQGTFNFAGAISVRGEERTAVNLNVFSQRVYSYNPQLTAGLLPFGSFIANIIQWKEAGPTDPFPPSG